LASPARVRGSLPLSRQLRRSATIKWCLATASEARILERARA
jgi:hypothetical protein